MTRLTPRLIATLSLAVLLTVPLGLAAPAAAQLTSQPTIITLPRPGPAPTPAPTAPARPACSADESPLVTIADIDASRATAAGRCVTIEAVAIGRLLATDVYARYRLQRVDNDPSSSGAVLGLYTEQSFRSPTHVRVRGRIDDCDSALAQVRSQPGTIPFQRGYCQFFKGLFIAADAIETGETEVMLRQPVRGAPEGWGNLSPLAAGDVRRQMEAATRRLLVALRTDDRAAVATMHGGGPGGTRSPVELERVESMLFVAPDSPWAAIRAPGDVAIELFGWREPLWADAAWREQRARMTDADAIACFSTRTNAADLWPIDSKDADNLPGRPYACTRIRLSGVGADGRVSFQTDEAPNGAVEPATPE